MYKYSKGVNLVAGGEKHRIYVKKSPTGVGKGVKGHVMVNHPTEDKGKWDTIDLTEKAGAKTVKDGKNATKKWHKENPMKMQEGSQALDLPIMYVNRNDPRIQASADSIYAYNATRGDSPAIIKYANNEIAYDKKVLKLNQESLKKYPKYKTGIEKSNKDLNERIEEIKASKPNDQPVKAGAFGSKVIIKKNKKPLGYPTIEDPEIERIKKKNKPIHYLSEERYSDNPVDAISETTYIPHKNTPIPGTQRYKIQKPVTSKIEGYPNLDKAKEIYPNITDKENSEILEKMNKDISEYKNTYHNPSSYYDPTQKYPWNTTNPNDVFAERDENSKFKKHGFRIENLEYNYESDKSEIPQFAKPKYRWLSEEEKKKEEEKKQEEITPKTPDDTPKETPKEEPKKTTKLPGGSGKFARYPNMKNQLGNLKTSRMVNAKKVENIVPTFVSGAKSVKQYRGDENLPEAKNGMKKGCGCKHSKSKYKYQEGTNNVTSNDEYMNYLSLIKDRLSKNSEGMNYYDFILNRYKNQYANPQSLDATVSKIKTSYEKKQKEEEEPENKIEVRRRQEPPKRSGVHATPTRKKFFRNFYREGIGALTIPEGSAIVTANGGKNKQALAAYKKGNYKLLNKIIDDMPEDNADKAQAGEKEVIGGKQSFEIRASKKGKAKNRLDMTKTAQDEIWQGENYDKKWIPEVQQALKDPKRYQKVLEYFKNYQGQDKETVQKILNLAQNKSPEEVKYAIKKLGTDRNIGPFHTTLREAIKPETPPETPPGTIPIPPPNPPGKISTPQDEYEEINAGEIKVPNPAMSFGETSAIGSVLAQGVPPNPRESYLKLDRYNYASQLPKTLQEIQLAEQAARENTRDIVGGDAGRYLAQAGNLSAARMKAANNAVIQDTLARQDILNKNVDLSNTELSTNRSLKDYYDDIKRQNINDYNALLVKGGQSFDESFDAYQKMKNENQLKAQELQLLQEANPNYTMVQDPKTGLMRSVYRFKKKPGSTTQSNTQFSTPVNSNNTLSGENLDLTTTDPNNPPTMFYRKGMKKAKTYKRK